MNYFRFFFGVIFAVIIAVIQISFISAMPGWFSQLNLFLLAVISILIFKDLKVSLCFAVGFGFVADIYSFSPFGLYSICFFLTALLSNFLLVNFFTDRSLYSFLALNFFGVIFYNFLFVLLSLILIFFEKKSFEIGSFFGLGEQVAMNIVFAFILFHLANYMSRSFQPVFLSKK